MAKRKPTKSSGARSAHPLALDFQIRHALAEADELFDNEDWMGARRVLQPLLRRAPANLQVMEELAYAYFQLGEWASYIDLADRIRERAPDRADIYLSLVGAEINATYVFLALKHLRAFVVRFPFHPERASAAEQLHKVQELASELLTEIRTDEGFPLAGDAAAGFLEAHEWMQVQLSAGHLAQAQELGETLLKQLPEWPPVLNNLSLVLGMQGRHAEALAYAERTLAIRPDHAFALAERIKRLFLLGRTEEARAAAAQAAESVFSNRRDDATLKLAEALALLGDDASLISLYERAKAAGRPQAPPRRAVLLCLAGAAHTRRGEFSAARKLWEKALVESPGDHVAKESLADLERPASLRNGPFLLQAALWYPWSWVEELMELSRSLKDADKARAAGRRFLAERPGLLPLLPILLDRGDESARQFALTVCTLAATPETLAMLRDFALGQRGTDRQRMDALSAVMNSALMLRGKVRMWLRGEWSEIEPIGFEITSAPLRRHPPNIERLAERAVSALSNGDLVTAEQTLAAALALAPDAPDLLNNLAMLRSLQGREADAQAILKDLRERFPDYSFAIFNTAQQLLAKGKARQALDLLKPVLGRERLHLTEFTMLCVIQVRAFLALKQIDSARIWFDMLADQVPDHPLVEGLSPLFRGEAAVEQSWQLGQ